jgi:hypothetical protein
VNFPHLRRTGECPNPNTTSQYICAAGLSSIALLSGCDSSTTQSTQHSVQELSARREEITGSAIDPKKLATCANAKAAAVLARKAYDSDYESRNPGAKSTSVSASELTSCRLVNGGAFVGKWGDLKPTRWRFVPSSGGDFSTNPHLIWISDEPIGSDDRIWFSEWRSENATDKKAKELSSLLDHSEAVQ